MLYFRFVQSLILKAVFSQKPEICLNSLCKFKILNEMVIAVDLGGTNIRAGRIEQGEILQHADTKLVEKENLQSTLDQLARLIESVMAPGVTGIGIGVPSVVDLKTGTVLDVTNIASWKRVELKQIMEDRFHVPVQVNNDVNCFILGEQRWGMARGYASAVGLAMGTGLGGGIIINNQLYAGVNCGAGEFGLVPYLDNNIEGYCSSGFFTRKYNTTALDTFNRAEAGDPEAKAVWREFGIHMGNAIKTVAYTYDPEVIILGGSLVKAWPHFSEAMFASMQDFEFPESMKKLKVFTSQNPNIQLLGASSLVSD
jgi:glucokinase